MQLIPVAPAPDFLAAQYRRGAKSVVLYVMELEGTERIRVILGLEPITEGRNPDYAWHASLSVGPYYGPAARAPTDQEASDAIAALERVHKFKLTEDTIYGTDANVRHFWEK